MNFNVKILLLLWKVFSSELSTGLLSLFRRGQSSCVTLSLCSSSVALYPPQFALTQVETNESFPSARDLRLLMTDKQIIIPHGPYFRCCALLLVGPVDHGQLKSRVLCHFKCITLLLGAPNFASVFALS